MATVAKTAHSAATAATAGSTAPQLLLKQYQRALGRWPRDNLRPDTQLQTALAKRLETKLSAGGSIDVNSELKQINALHSLVENRYKTKVRRRPFSKDS